MIDMKLLVDSSVFIDAFDPTSPNHAESMRFLDHIHKRNLIMAMPAHAWFEVECALKKLSLDKKFVGPMFDGKMKYPVELIHIDDDFITKYRMVDIPYIKAGDHIFVAVAKVNNYPLVTNDTKMFNVALKAGVRVFEPKDLRRE